MKKIYDLSDLFMEYLKDIYSAEKQQLEYLPKFLKKMEYPDLKKLVEKNQEETWVHENRISDIFSFLKNSIHANDNRIMEELIERTYKLVKSSDNTEILEASLIASLQEITHYKIATYGILKSLGITLGYKNEIINLLSETLDEIKVFDKDLTKLAIQIVNKKAKGTFVET